MTMEMERSQQTQRLGETNLHIELQNCQHQVALKEQHLAEANQQKEKVWYIVDHTNVMMGMAQLRSDVKLLENNLALKTTHLDNLSRQLDAKSKLLQDSERNHQQAYSQMQTVR